MEQSTENKIEVKNRLIYFYKYNKIKIYIFLFFLILILISFTFITHYNDKKNNLVAEKYIKAGIYLEYNKKNNAKSLYEEIIYSKNKFYSILALNTIIEKNLIIDKKKVIKYFDVLEKYIAAKDQKDLITFKKALYLIKISEVQNGKNLLNKLVDQNSTLKPIIKELLQNN